MLSTNGNCPFLAFLWARQSLYLRNIRGMLDLNRLLGLRYPFRRSNTRETNLQRPDATYQAA